MEERENGVIVPSRGGKSLFGIAAASRKMQQQQHHQREEENAYAPSSSACDVAVTENVRRKKKHKRLQEFLTPEYIADNVYGPPIGHEFDSLPYRAFISLSLSHIGLCY